MGQGRMLHRLDPATGRIRTSWAVLPSRRGGDVGAVDAAGPAVFVTAGPRILRIGSDGAIAARTRLAHKNVYTRAVLDGPRLLVIAGRRMTTIERGAIRSISVRLPGEPAAIAVDRGTAWVGGGDYVWALDPASGDAKGVRVQGVGVLPRGVAARDGRLWIAAGDALVRADPATGRVLRRVPGPADLVALAPGGALWSSDYRSDRLVRRDPGTGAPTAPPIRLPDDISTLVASGDAVWVGLGHPAVLRVDPKAALIDWRTDIPYT